MIFKKIFKNTLKLDKRTLLIKKNTIGSFVLKFIVVALDFFIVPLTLSYLTQTNYGIWLTINSMIRWFNLFDLGISHGYRNKLSIAFENTISYTYLSCYINCVSIFCLSKFHIV